MTTEPAPVVLPATSNISQVTSEPVINSEEKPKGKLVPVLLFLNLIGLAVLIYFVANVFLNKDTLVNPTPTPTATVLVTENPSVITPTTDANTTPVVTGVETMQLKFYVFDKAKDPDVMDCNAPTFVVRDLPKSSTPLKDSIDYLIHSFKLTAAEKTAGLVNNFEDAVYADRLGGFNLKSAAVSNLIATLTFEDTKAYSSGGSCRGGQISAQITNTAKQFPTVTSVKYLPENTLFQP